MFQFKAQLARLSAAKIWISLLVANLLVKYTEMNSSGNPLPTFPLHACLSRMIDTKLPINPRRLTCYSHSKLQDILNYLLHSVTYQEQTLALLNSSQTDNRGSYSHFRPTPPPPSLGSSNDTTPVYCFRDVTCGFAILLQIASKYCGFL